MTPTWRENYRTLVERVTLTGSWTAFCTLTLGDHHCELLLTSTTAWRLRLVGGALAAGCEFIAIWIRYATRILTSNVYVYDESF